MGALERTCTKHPVDARRYDAGYFRIMGGESARNDDMMHTQPATLQDLGETATFRAWQTEVVAPTRRITRTSN